MSVQFASKVMSILLRLNKLYLFAMLLSVSCAQCKEGIGPVKTVLYFNGTYVLDDLDRTYTRTNLL
jgi:hypothetical protein